MNIKQFLLQSQRPLLDNDRATDVLRQNKGLIPIDVVPSGGGKVIWLDVGDHRFTEAKFCYSLDKIVGAPDPPRSLETNLDLLISDDLLGDDVIRPTGFLFFVHRCGSTLLAKALARSARNIVMNEATTLHDGLCSYLSKDWSEPISTTPGNVNILRNLILALGRRRADNQRSYFVKFNPWHSAFMDVFTSAFPEVPCLFLYRDVAEIIVSVLKVPAPIMSTIKGTKFAAFLSGLSAEETAELSDVRYFSRLYQQFMVAALNSSSSQLTFLSYDQLNASNLALILSEGYGVSFPAEELALMQSQFERYSKDDSNTSHFSSDEASKQQAVTVEIKDAIADNELVTLYEKMALSEKNIITPKKLSM